jgi:hypothetical protein
MTTTNNAELTIEGKKIGLFSFGFTVVLFSSCLVIYLAAGGSFNPLTMYISDLGEIPGWTSVIYKSGMIFLVPVRFLFLLFILSVLKQFRIHKGYLNLLLTLGILTSLGTIGMSAVSYELSNILHIASAFVYFFPALLIQAFLSAIEAKRIDLPKILPISGFVNVGGYAFFLVSLILALKMPGFPKFLATASEWTIFITLMLWLVVHSLYLRAPVTGTERP